MPITRRQAVNLANHSTTSAKPGQSHHSCPSWKSTTTDYVNLTGAHDDGLNGARLGLSSIGRCNT
ncbi:hypothetical protein SAMN04489745_0048 [Arthrobacter woluwensis]|uniref:Uncharacterized protein n=1 Tax=Arthrobacter woluwensis TaxID=156980 RepID=A0A1H4I570_9MICC|nr:hypothetical protein SAMN04489745_0048 [Arthrobacter woluwensis]